ncbi:MAG: glycosyltransferase [Clostridia bacterium]|nr:glycosyltransferase [Clostridia bacterium]
MKILWITNTALGPIGEKLYGRRQGGLWMDALLTDFKEKAELSLVVATTAKIASPLRIEEDSIVYYALPDDIPLFYDENRPGNKAAWRTLIEVEKPDLIQIWGTEFSHGLCALREAGNIPSVIYMQGYLGAISRHYFAGMTERELDYAVSFRDVLRRDTIRQQQKVFAENTKKEAEMFARSKRIISENEWCNMSVRAVEPDVKIYTCPLSVNKAFSKVAWKRGQIEEHSIMATASGYPLKGLHMLLRAVALLKKEYPDVKLYVPGAKMGAVGGIQTKLHRTGYAKYIQMLISDLGLSENVVWLGPLPQEELAKQYEKTHVFVLSSSIENHSSSLKEAMMVGVPSVASIVGGVPEYVSHGEDGFLYRFEEYEIMAGYVRRLFEDDALAEHFSGAGREKMLALHGESATSDVILNIYREILEEKA